MTGGADERKTGRTTGPDGTVLLAHDIRSAVSDVIGGVRLMDRDSLPAQARTQLDRVQSSAELLARLVEDLLDGAPRDTAGPVGNLNLRRFIDDELRRWHGAAQGTGVIVNTDLGGGLPDIVQLPLLPLRRIIANLMSNALRHSTGDRITLGTELLDDGTLNLCVQDNGAGLPDDMVWPPEQGDPPEGERHGMGLQIASAHARDMGARILSERSQMGGARVMLSIPKSVWSRIEEPGPDDMLPDLRGFRILVADDSGTNRMLVQVMLTRLGAECEFARDGIEALNWLARERFDLALIDVEMPMLGGLDVMQSERLRQARGVAPPTSMVAMTAYVRGDNKDAILEAGADGILSKPLGTIEMFGAAIWQFLKAAPDSSGWAPETAPALSAATLSELMRAAGPAQEADLLDRLREDLRIVERALTDALDRDDLPAVAAQTHVLLSLSSAIGALPTQETARRLNRLARDGQIDAVRATGKVCLTRLAQLRAELVHAN
ncbi:response regulator [Jannaschia donghaensis]|uniref:histidine kinase n=1 Tax=Jannaschia donghaensis TaxID=420998 RepID=A0A0M6YL81_9RHOB|nr:response regulator [Jannaschia donghaensis]CTQ51118.1 Aerobic respiration control sensor protein ArcB [Jannaschia donghaensis]